MSTGRVRRVLVGRASPVFLSACFVMWIFECSKSMSLTSSAAISLLRAPTYAATA